MPIRFKIRDRPLLPWWVYALYFLLGILLLIARLIYGDDMKTAQGQTANLAQYGRHGDTMLAHVNPWEAAILRALGGSGTINPKTGLREYFLDGDGDVPDRFGGTGADDFSHYSEGEARERDFYGSEYNPNNPNFNPDLSPATPPTQQRGFLDNFLNPQKPSILSPSARITYELTKALGDYIGKPLSDRFGGDPKMAGEVRDYPSMALSEGPANDYFDRATGVQPAVVQAPSYTPPPEVAAPLGIGFPAGATDLQKRAQIATYGTQSNQGAYRTPDAMRYYGNLIARALIGGGGQVPETSPNILPVEQNYLQQQYGINQSANARALIDALRPYWSK